MTDKTDETGKGPHRPGDAPKRPYATIDLQATEIGGKAGQAAAPAGGKPEGRASGLPLPGWDGWRKAWTMLAGALAAIWGGAQLVVRSNTFLSHLVAGVAGAVLTLAVSSLLGLLPTGKGVPDVAGRLAAVEKALVQRPALSADAMAKLAAADARLGKLEERVQAAQSKLAADAKALEARIPPAGLTERLAKLEAALAALSADERSGSAPAARFADVEKLAGEASEAKAASARVERDLAGLKADAASLQRSLEALKGSVEERMKDAAKAGDLVPVLAKIAALERDVRVVLKTEGERIASTQQVLLSLEIANLKRALDRGNDYAPELDAVRKAAGGTVDLSALERYSRTGVPALGTLAEEFRRVAGRATDAESERPDASVLDRLVAGARSIVRLRKARYDANDASVEATLARMESALKDGQIGEVLAQGKRLPPKAAEAAADWLRKLEARYAADRTIADIEAGLKASLSVQQPETKR